MKLKTMSVTVKTIIISLILLGTINAQNIWYVDKNTPAGLSGDGTSWATAWKNTNSMTAESGSIDWSVIGDGDTIYFSGGTDSTVYLPYYQGQGHYIDGTSSVQRTFTSTVVIAPSWETGHNGKVYFVQDDNSSTRGLVMGSYINNVKLFGITFLDTRTSTPGGGLIMLYGNNNTIENCNILTAGLTTIFYLNGYRLTVRGCNIIDPPNERVAAQDVFGLSSGRGGHTIDHNLMISNNNYTMVSGDGANMTVTSNSLTDTDLPAMTANYHVGVTIHCGNSSMTVTSNDASTFYGTGGWTGGTPANGTSWNMEGAHRDGLQFSEVDDHSVPGENLENVISNNIIIDKATRGTGWNGLVYTSTVTANARFLIYNNIFVNKEEISSAGIFMYEANNSTYSTSVRVLNNTIIMKGDGAINPIDGLYSTGIPLGISDVDTLVIKNNLIVGDTTLNCFYSLQSSPSITYKDFNNNIFASDDYNAESFAVNDNGQVRTWDQWRSLLNSAGTNRDANSDTMKADAVIFENKYGTLATDYRTLTGVGQGEDLSSEYPFLRYDINGNDRGSSWDIGAIQYNSVPPIGNDDVNVKSKVFLQGPFNTNLMNTNLSQNGLLPTAQPFNSAPWNYNGSESLGSGSTSSYVDWVLVELRNSSNPTQIVARKAAILKNDGTLLNTDGSIGVPFSNVPEGAYYIAVFQRNHLAVMSATPVQLTTNSQLYDFTTGMNKAYGTNPMKDLGNGKFGMYAGDGNGNGGITIADRNEVWLPQNGTMGYLKGDFNLDGGVTASDVNLYWNINNGTMTQVP